MPLSKPDNKRINEIIRENDIIWMGEMKVNETPMLPVTSLTAILFVTPTMVVFACM